MSKAMLILLMPMPDAQQRSRSKRNSKIHINPCRQCVDRGLYSLTKRSAFIIHCDARFTSSPLKNLKAIPTAIITPFLRCG